MQIERHAHWVHDHRFDLSSEAAERSTRLVMWITAAMMVVEIVAGWWFNSMALLADGWHMSSHAVAIGLSATAYASARRYAQDPRFAFGTWKIEVLAGFSSALFLLGVAAMMVFGSVERIISPQAIGYQEAIVVAVLGLVVNIVCALILGKAHHGHGHAQPHAPSHAQPHAQSHDHAHDRDHGHAHAQPRAHEHGHARHHDLNLKSAYLHVMADAATSVLAIVALIGGWLFGWAWLDPVMGIVGAVLVAVWAKGLMLETAKVLLDREMDHPLVDRIRTLMHAADPESDITDLHVWRVGKTVYACAMTIVTHDDLLTSTIVRERLSAHPEVVHATIEIHHCAQAVH